MKIINIEDSNYPKRLKNIQKPPQTLYVEGNEKLLNNNSLAIVGSRDCSEYGIKYTEKFAKELSNCNITIISGLAIGVDAIAHKMANQYKGNTIAVLGSGLNKIYPKENIDLAKNIIENGGCIITEYEKDMEVDMKNFPIRNRIISGISLGILIIEAKYRSGSGITAKYGFEQEKKVFCLPRDIGITNGVGTNNLIKQGAKLVTNSIDILEELNIEDENILKLDKKVETKDKSEEYINKKQKKDNNTNKNIPKEYIDIYNIIQDKPINIQNIKQKSKKTIAEINTKLTMMEIQGYIKRLPGNNYKRV